MWIRAEKLSFGDMTLKPSWDRKRKNGSMTVHGLIYFMNLSLWLKSLKGKNLGWRTGTMRTHNYHDRKKRRGTL